ncbi:MAG: hypothetical protein ACFFFC_20135, partial [Candidatus Thorarchaeota archaeon]
MSVLTRLPYSDRLFSLYRRQLYPIYRKLGLTYSNSPIVFCNSIPKSGTHLLLQILRGLETIGPFWERESFVRTYYRRTGVNRRSEDI